MKLKIIRFLAGDNIPTLPVISQSMLRWTVIVGVAYIGYRYGAYEHLPASLTGLLKGSKWL